MSVQKLDFGQPLFEIEYVEQEERYYVPTKSVVINLAERSGKSLRIKGVPLAPLKGTVVQGVWLEDVDRAVVVLDYERYDIDDPEVIAMIKGSWKSLYECSGIERHKGIPYYKSTKTRVGGDTELNVCFTEAMAPSGPHKDHDRDFDEVHAQIRGVGKMQIFEENDTSTFYQEFILAPGCVHDKIYDENGEYPWHQYHSVTRAVYMPIEIDR